MRLILSALAISGLFAGSVTTLAWNRVSAWKHMPATQFKEDFAETIRVADKLQPALLGTALVLTLWFVVVAHGTAQILALGAVLLQGSVLALSALILVPLQRRLITSYKSNEVETEALRDMRKRWYVGHIERSIVSVITLLFVAAAAFV